VIHAREAALTVAERRRILGKIGEYKQILKSAGTPLIPADEILVDNGVRYTENRDRLLREAELCKDDITLPTLQDLELDPDHNIFF
jgi:hypothetical protein